MPTLPPAPCPIPGCPELTGGRRCDKHRRMMEAGDRGQRGSSNARGYDYAWQKLRKQYLAENPLCEPCLDAGRVELATVVDHKIPHRGNPKLRLAWGNLQSMSKTCHDRKTATEDTGRRHGRFAGRGS